MKFVSPLLRFMKLKHRNINIKEGLQMKKREESIYKCQNSWKGAQA